MGKRLQRILGLLALNLISAILIICFNLCFLLPETGTGGRDENMKCIHSNQTWYRGQWFCSDCDELPTTNRRRPLTDHEKLKLSWYRDEKKWIDDIKSRKIVVKNGQKMVVSNSGILPMQPRSLWKAPKQH